MRFGGIPLCEGGEEFGLERLHNKTTRFDSSYSRGHKSEILFPESDARYSAKQNLGDITSLWDLTPNSGYDGLYFHFLKGNVPPIASVWILDGAKAQGIFDPLRHPDGSGQKAQSER